VPVKAGVKQKLCLKWIEFGSTGFGKELNGGKGDELKGKAGRSLTGNF
jgi:hypothetical protein